MQSSTQQRKEKMCLSYLSGLEHKDNLNIGGLNEKGPDYLSNPILLESYINKD
ncbi:hypothetical protein F030043B2_12080 [Bacteroides fragilis]